MTVCNRCSKRLDMVKEVEILWMERTNTLIRTMIDYCKSLQRSEALIQKSTETPIIFNLDKVILELQKRKFNNL